MRLCQDEGGQQTPEKCSTLRHMAKKQFTDPININAPLFTSSTDSRGKTKISWGQQSPGASMSQHKGFSPVQAKGSSRLLYSPILSPLERGHRLLWNSTSGLKLGLPGTHTMMTENLESTSFLPIWHTGYDKKQDTWGDKRKLTPCQDCLSFWGWTSSGKQNIISCLPILRFLVLKFLLF